MNQPKNQRRAFIAAPANVSLDVLKNELSKRNIQAYTSYDLSPTSSSITSHIQNAIEKSDLIVAVIPDRATPNVFFELGMAQAMKKPLFVIVSPTFGVLPSDISETLYLRTDPNNRVALSFALDQYIRQIEKPLKKPGKKTTRGAALGVRADKFLAMIRRRGISATQLEKIVAEMFRQTGAEVVVENRRIDDAVDVVIWSDDLQTVAGNPVLVQVKNRVRNTAEFSKVISNIERYRTKSGAKLAILVVNSSMTYLTSKSLAHGVLTVLLSDLIERLRKKSLGEVIRGLLNENARAGGR